MEVLESEAAEAALEKEAEYVAALDVWRRGRGYSCAGLARPRHSREEGSRGPSSEPSASSSQALAVEPAEAEAEKKNTDPGSKRLSPPPKPGPRKRLERFAQEERRR